MPATQPDFGSPRHPLGIRCTSTGSHSTTDHYLSLVADDGRQFCFRLTHSIAALHAAQCAKIIASWPVEPAESA